MRTIDYYELERYCIDRGLTCAPVEVIKSMADVEAEPVRYGCWEWETEDKYRCSECGSVTRVDEVMSQPVYERCPYCGAKMRKEDKR